MGNLNNDKAASVTQALNTRITVRDFLDTPVPQDVLTRIFQTAQRSPSGGNLQPWHVHVLTGDKLNAFRDEAIRRLMAGQKEEDTHPAYPSPLWEPQRSWRYKVGEDMYATMGIAREDKPARMKWLMRNNAFFGAPVGVIITTHKDQHAPQYLDIGIYLQSLMLLAREEGLHSAPQGWWRTWPDLCAEYLDVDPDDEVIVGMGLGYGNPDHPVNGLEADRAELSEAVKFY